MNRNLGNWVTDCSAALTDSWGMMIGQSGILWGLREYFLENMAGFKSQLCQLLAVCPWANYLTSLCFSHLVYINREDGTTYLKRWLWGLNELTFAGCILNAQYTLAIKVNTVAVSVSMKFQTFVNPRPLEPRVFEECCLKTLPHRM